MSKLRNVLLAATSSAIILLAGSLMLPCSIAWWYKLTPQYPLCNDNIYLISWATNGIYVAILIVAVLAGVAAYVQLGYIRSQEETQTIFYIYNYLYDEKFSKGKKKVYDKKQMLEKKGNIRKPIPEIDHLLLIYNNIALLVLNNKLNKNNLPIQFYANAIKVNNICQNYINFRKNSDKPYTDHFAEHFLKFIPIARKYTGIKEA